MPRIRALVTDPVQREALLRLVEAVAPTRAVIDGAHWHPIGGPLSLTVATADGGLALGVGAELGDRVRVRAHIAIANVVGSELLVPPTPFSLQADVPLQWTRPEHRIGLDAVRASARIGASDQQVRLVLAGLDLD